MTSPTDKLKAAANAYAYNNHPPDPEFDCHHEVHESFHAGAAWMKAEILALLRSEEAKGFANGFYDQGIHPVEDDWATWLESELEEEKE